MKKAVCYFLKGVVAGIISLVLLSLFSLVYYHPPIAVEQPDGSTNYKLTPNAKWSYMWEGFGYGTTDSRGYNNAYYPDCTNPDIVFVGSSYLEALQVPEDANFVYLLNEKLDLDVVSDNDFQCYNLGISGHFFEVTASNFRYVAEQYKDAKCIVIETAKVEYSPSELDGMLAGSFRSPLEKKGILHETAQKIPYVRLLYKKLNETMTAKNAGIGLDNPENVSVSEEDNLQIYTEKMNQVLSNIAGLSRQQNVKPVILLHERFFVDENGNITLENKQSYKNAFLKCCKANGIAVIDAVSEMIAHYQNTCEFSYGYSNGVPGEGHLNKTGHQIIADVLYQEIDKMEVTQ